jgi:DNA-binding transcriptional ArsR family regulator
VTKHLRVLEHAGLVRSLRVGRESRFAYRPEPIEAAKSYLDTVSAQWDDALARLRAFVEE